MSTKFSDLVCIAIGEASMCWSEPPSGVFDSERALKIVDRIVAEYEKKEKFDSQLMALAEIMRPFLELHQSKLNKESGEG